MDLGNGQGVSCLGGSGAGWTGQAHIRYKNAAGVWQDGENPNQASDYTNFPYGGAVCASSTHYANGHTATIKVIYDEGSDDCSYFGTPYTNDEAAQNGVKYDQGGDNLYTDGVCSHSIQGWDVHWDFSDYGGSATDSANSSTRSC
jgi:hypothetical protein